jgi:hypothetical protein
VFWTSVLEIIVGTVVGVIAGWLITASYARRGSQELRQEAERLRRLTLKLIEILAASGQIEVSTRDPETGEPASWPVGPKPAQILYDAEAPSEPRESSVPKSEGDSPTPEQPRPW